MKFTQQASMDLNGGSFDIFADGKRTNLVRITRAGGPPKYLKTADVISDGESEFDLLANGGVGMDAWLYKHVKVVES